MCKSILMVLIAACLSLFTPASSASEADNSLQGTETKMLHAEHVFDAKVTIGGLLDFGKSKHGEDPWLYRVYVSAASAGYFDSRVKTGRVFI